jgi:hypothetical protein
VSQWTATPSAGSPSAGRGFEAELQQDRVDFDLDLVCFVVGVKELYAFDRAVAADLADLVGDVQVDIAGLRGGHDLVDGQLTARLRNTGNCGLFVASTTRSSSQSIVSTVVSRCTGTSNCSSA